MSHKIALLFLASLFFTTACGNIATPTNAVAILPKDCRMQINQQMPLTLDGVISPNAVINWESDAGSLSFAAPGLNALFTAPSQPTVVTISVTISSGTPSVQIPITHQCIVMGIDSGSPMQPLQPTGIIVVENGSTAPQVLSDAPNTQPTVIISEVMANPCGGIEFKKWNEYVELYNFGDQPVDVNGWWLADTGGAGSPDQLVSWSQRNPAKPLAGSLISNSTIIPAKGFALILSPSYNDGEFPYAQPYAIPANTVILTASESRSIGDDAASIVGDGEGRDVLVLYKGGPSVIQETISTYGTPKPAQYVSDIKDNYLDNLPLDLHECSSIERVVPTVADSVENWREVPYGSPGEAPY
jgi:hypothetical protein